MLTPYDDYPIHQTALPIAHMASGDPNHYDRFWFNGYTENYYFGIGMAVYPNRGIIDGAFSVVSDGVQRSVFASGRIPVDRTETKIGPLAIDILEPLRTMRVRCDAKDLGIEADVTFTTRTVAYEEPRQTVTNGNKTAMDSTRLTQWGTWNGRINDRTLDKMLGTKDRSWGVRPIGAPTQAAPEMTLPQIFFLWAPINWDDCCTHFLCFERANGDRWASGVAQLDLVGENDALFGPEANDRIHPLAGATHDIRWAQGLRRSEGATLTLLRHDGTRDRIELEPTLTFRMRGIGYMHPEWGHGHWHGEEEVHAEEHKVEDLDNVEPWNIHVQQVMKATWGDKTGLGVLEQLAFGDHHPSGLSGIIDGYAG
jgi:hypothetical protein